MVVSLSQSKDLLLNKKLTNGLVNINQIQITDIANYLLKERKDKMVVKFKDLNDGEVTIIEASTLEDAFNQACGLFGTEYVCDCMEIVSQYPLATN